jgi:subfamily B ATP-binding cassette protein MsbA
VNAFLRLIAYARPYRGRLAAAAAAMIVYGAASAGVAALIQPILDRVLPRHEELAQIITAILALYLIKGVGAYLSGYWMTDVGQRVVGICGTCCSRTSSANRPRFSPLRRADG